MPLESQSPTQADSRIALIEAARNLIANAHLVPDPAMQGATDCYVIPCGDYDALSIVLRDATVPESPPPCPTHEYVPPPGYSLGDCATGDLAPLPRPIIPNIEPLKLTDLEAYEPVLLWRPPFDKADMGECDVPRAEVALELAEHFQFAQPPAEFNEQLRLWLTFHTLAHLFQKAWSTASGPNNQRDRLMLKWNEYVALAKWARTLYFKAADKAQKGGAA